MSSRGFLLRTHEDDSFDQPEMRPLSPNIIVSRADFFAAQEEGEKIVTDVITSQADGSAVFMTLIYAAVVCLI